MKKIIHNENRDLNIYIVILIVGAVLLLGITPQTIADQLIAPYISSGSIYCTISGSYGSNSTCEVGQDDVSIGSNRFHRGYVWFDLSSLPSNAQIDNVRLRYDNYIVTKDSTGIHFPTRIGPMFGSKATWDSASNSTR